MSPSRGSKQPRRRSSKKTASRGTICALFAQIMQLLSKKSRRDIRRRMLKVYLTQGESAVGFVLFAYDLIHLIISLFFQLQPLDRFYLLHVNLTCMTTFVFHFSLVHNSNYIIIRSLIARTIVPECTLIQFQRDASNPFQASLQSIGFQSLLLE